MNSTRRAFPDKALNQGAHVVRLVGEPVHAQHYYHGLPAAGQTQEFAMLRSGVPCPETSMRARSRIWSVNLAIPRKFKSKTRKQKFTVC